MKLGAALVTCNGGSGSRTCDYSTGEPKPPATDDILSLTIESYLNTCSWPLVVVDDGSTDNTPDIIERYKAQVQVITHENSSGLAACISEAFALLQDQGCDLLCQFADDIEFLTAAWDYRVIRHFEENRRAGALSGVQITPFGAVRASGEVVIRPGGPHCFLGVHNGGLFEGFLVHTGEITIGDMQCDATNSAFSVYRANALKRAGGFKEEFTSREWLIRDASLRILEKNFHCVSMGSIFYLHRECETARSSQVSSAELEAWEEIWGFDPQDPDLAAVYEKWDGTYLVHNLYKQADDTVIYVGP